MSIRGLGECIAWWVTLAVFGLFGCAAEAPEPEPSPVQNLLLIVVDTLRADHVGAYGGAADTPVMDGLAARGVRFERAYSHIPITGPSHSSLFTGLLPFDHGVRNNDQILAAEPPTLAEILAAGGRQTAAVVSLGVLKRKFGHKQGFEHYGDHFPLDWMKDAREVTDEVLALVESTLEQPFLLWAHYSDPHEPYTPPDDPYPEVRLSAGGVELGTFRTDGRVHSFELDLPTGATELWLEAVGSHDPSRAFEFKTIRATDGRVELRPPETWRVGPQAAGAKPQGRFPARLQVDNGGEEPLGVTLRIACKEVLELAEIRRRYIREVEFADRQIGRLLEGLRTRGLLDDTLIVFVSDHGEGLGDHGLVGHISQLYDSLLRVPLIMTAPGVLPEGAVIREPVGIVDVLPTVVELMGMPPVDDRTGRSLVPLIRQDAWSERPVFGATYRPEAHTDRVAVVAEGHKLIRSWTGSGERDELYDLRSDPGELRDLAPSGHLELRSLQSILDARLQAATAVVEEAELDEDEIESLRALGYVH